MISIIIPIFNSEKTIKKLLDSLIIALKNKFEFEIILVNDCSTDNSEEICKNLAFENSSIKLISLSTNVGEHNAVMAGLNNCKGNYAVIMDDDLQHAPDSIIELIEYALKNENNYDVIYTYFEKKHHGFLRNLGSKFNDAIANVLLDKPKDLYLSSYKILNRFLINQLIVCKSPYIYIDGILLRSTKKIGKILTKHQERKYGKSGYNFTKLLSLWSSMSTSFSILPLRISLMMGIILAGLGFIMSIIAFIEKLVSGTTVPGYASIFIIVTVFSGANLIALGLLGEYVGRIFLSINNKPQFIVKKIWKKEDK